MGDKCIGVRSDACQIMLSDECIQLSSTVGCDDISPGDVPTVEVTNYYYIFDFELGAVLESFCEKLKQIIRSRSYIKKSAEGQKVSTLLR